MKDTVKATLQGIGIGSSIMLIFIAIFNISIDLLGVISVYLLGAICGFLPIVYKLERMPLPLKLIIHLLGSLITFFVVSTMNHWVPLNVGPLLSALFIFTIIFLVIWFIFMIINIQQSKRINAKLKEM